MNLFQFSQNEGKKCETATGNYTLGIFEVDVENYASMSVCLKELAEQIKALNEVEIAGKTFAIKKYLGGDLKFLAAAMGLNAANSRFPCVWCTITNEQFKESDDYESSISDPAKGARTLEMGRSVFNLNTVDERKG